MRVKRRFIAAIVIAGLFILAAALALKPADSVPYEGKPLRSWALAARSGDPQAVAAIKRLGTNAVPGLIDLLQRKEPFFHRQAARLSQKLPRRIARPLLGWSVRNDSVTSRCAAAQCLGSLGALSEPAVPALVQALHDRETQVVMASATALGQIGPRAVPELMRALTDTNGFVRSCAASALGQVGAGAESALPGLIELFGDTNQFARDAAGYSAGLIGAHALRSISNLFDHGDKQAREAALKQLVVFRRSLQEPVPALVKMARDPDPDSRRLAIVGLTALRLGDNPTINTLTNALVDPAPEVRLAAVKGLKMMAWRAHEALPQLILMLADPASEVRLWTISTLGEIGPRAVPAVPELERVARTQPELRSAIAEATVKIQSLPGEKP